jgi:hypothetical protein
VGERSVIERTVLVSGELCVMVSMVVRNIER